MSNMKRSLLHIPLNSPLHGRISNDHGWQPEEDLVLCASEGVEDGVVCSTSKRPLTVGGEAICSNTLLWWRACCSVSFVMLAGGFGRNIGLVGEKRICERWLEDGGIYT